MAKKWVKRFLISDGIVLLLLAVPLVYAATEAPTGYDNLTNGFTNQATFDLDRATYEGREEIDDGLGPIYNAQACAECHQTPVTGSVSQITELRVGRIDIFSGVFTDRPGGSLINDRAIDASIQEVVAGADNAFDFRSSLNTLGDGFIEALPDSFFTNAQAAQPAGMKGQIITVPVLEAAAGTRRIARFGWKNQHASLLSFSADAYLNEMGITSPLQPTENTSNGVSVAAFDQVADPEEAPTPANPFGPDVEFFARFMRATKPPPRGPITSDVTAGQTIFSAIGCQRCHIPSATTAPVGTSFNGGKFIVPAALGDKIIHPYSDFMLHDVGTGDGIVQNGGQSTLFKLRTPPLWGLRAKSRLMHDTVSFTRNDAILRHTNEAEPVIQNYINLSTTQKNQLISFINSL